MIKRRLLRAILNSGVSAWKEFSYDEKKQAILEVTPYTYNIKYATITLSSVAIKKGSGNVSVLTKGYYTDIGFVFGYSGDLCKLNVVNGVAKVEKLDIKKSPVLILSLGNTLEEIESISSFDFEGEITPIIAVKFTSNTPYICLNFTN